MVFLADDEDDPTLSVVNLDNLIVVITGILMMMIYVPEGD